MKKVVVLYRGRSVEGVIKKQNRKWQTLIFPLHLTFPANHAPYIDSFLLPFRFSLFARFLQGLLGLKEPSRGEEEAEGLEDKLEHFPCNSILPQLTSPRLTRILQVGLPYHKTLPRTLKRKEDY